MRFETIKKKCHSEQLAAWNLLWSNQKTIVIPCRDTESML